MTNTCGICDFGTADDRCDDCGLPACRACLDLGCCPDCVEDEDPYTSRPCASPRGITAAAESQSAPCISTPCAPSHSAPR